jgi:protein-tyrosine phosphatase
MIMASMRNWLNGESLDGTKDADMLKREEVQINQEGKGQTTNKKDRVIVVHCKAGKGRSGTMACSYLISQCGWTPQDALARFTARRMRPKFGAGVSIPSQLRWVSYVDRWAKGGKVYVDREVEVVEVQVWGLRHGVKVSIRGFVDEGRKIRNFHTFKREERYIVEGNAPSGGGVTDLVSDMAGLTVGVKLDKHGEVEENASYDSIIQAGNEAKKEGSMASGESNAAKAANGQFSSQTSAKLSSPISESSSASMSSLPGTFPTSSPSASQSSFFGKRAQSQFADIAEPGGQAVVFRPREPIRLPNSDVNLSLERRNKTPASMGLTMVTAVAHVWFNAFFEGKGPEQDGHADDSGVFEIPWDAMDGIKGSSQKGTRAAERIAIIWRAPETVKLQANPEPTKADASIEATAGSRPDIRITEPGLGSPVPQMKAADWQGSNKVDPNDDLGLGLRKESPDSTNVSKASSIHSQEGQVSSEGGQAVEGADDDSLKGVKVSGPAGEAELRPVEEPRAGDVGILGNKQPNDGLGKSTEVADATAKQGFIVE